MSNLSEIKHIGAALWDHVPLKNGEAFSEEGLRECYSVQLLLMDQGRSATESQRILLNSIQEIRDARIGLFIETVDEGDQYGKEDQ